MFKKFNEKWYYSVLIILILGFIGFVSIPSPSLYWVYISIYLPFIACLLAIFFGIKRLIKKKYLEGILQIFCTIILIGTMYVSYSFALMFSPYDYFADDLEIPTNVRFEKPFEIFYEDEKPEINVTKEDVILYDYFQPGIYKYDIYLNKIEKGKVYLKIFEITKNQILSEKRIRRDSEIDVENLSNELKKFQLNDDFTVFEGDWGKFYGSRIEVWFKPEEKNKPERKILTKNYIIQGWMR